GVPAARHANPAAGVRRALDARAQLRDRGRPLQRAGRAALIPGPVAPGGRDRIESAGVRIARLAHLMTASEPTPSPAVRAPRTRTLPTPGPRRATVIGAGSFGTALAVLLARRGLRTTLLARTPEQAERLGLERENREYLPGVA